MAGDLAARRCPPARGGSVSAPSLSVDKKPPADAFGRIGIVVAGDPDPVAAALQASQRGAVGVGEPRRAAAVMEAVAERDHHARRIARDQRAEPRQRRRRVVGRQQHAARGEARAFFQMQIGDRRAGPAPANRGRRPDRRQARRRRRQARRRMGRGCASAACDADADGTAVPLSRPALGRLLLQLEFGDAGLEHQARGVALDDQLVAIDAASA